jgi:hypothetical protein
MAGAPVGFLNVNHRADAHGNKLTYTGKKRDSVRRSRASNAFVTWSAGQMLVTTTSLQAAARVSLQRFSSSRHRRAEVVRSRVASNSTLLFLMTVPSW